jgi:hypothetical protein
MTLTSETANERTKPFHIVSIYVRSLAQVRHAGELASLDCDGAEAWPLALGRDA